MDPILDLREKDKTSSSPQSDEVSKLKTSKTRDVVWHINKGGHGQNDKRIILAALIILAMGVFLAVRFSEYMFGTFLCLASILIFIFNYKKPGIDTVAIGPNGILMGHDHYNYRDLKSFWIIYEPKGLKELIIEPGLWYLPMFYIPLESVDPLAIRAILIKYLTEKFHETSLLSAVLRKIGL